MNAVKFKVWDAQNVRRGKGLFINSVPKSTITWTNRRCRFFENGKTKKRSRFAPFSQADCSKVKTWGGCSRVDWKHWNHECQKSKLLAVGCQWVENKSGRRHPSRTLYSIVRLRLKRFLVILTDFERFHSLYLFSSVFQGVTFYKCNVKVVINCSNCDHMWKQSVDRILLICIYPPL